MARWLLGCALAYTVFVVYGSLVPLEYAPMALDEAIARFAAIPFFELGVAKRADWVANALLFIPLSLLWFGALASFWQRRAGRVAGAALVLGGGLGLGVGIEFVQLWFPQRTVSQNDLYAQTIGAVIGLVAWRAARAPIESVYRAWREPRHGRGKFRLVLGSYAAGLFVYHVMPLDLTISVAELHEKWKAGRMLLDPFRLGSGSAAEIAYELVTDVLIWVPIAALAMLETGGRVGRSIAWTLGAAIALEFAQLLVFTRVTDTRDLVTAAAGAWIGCRALVAFDAFGWRAARRGGGGGEAGADDHASAARDAAIGAARGDRGAGGAGVERSRGGPGTVGWLAAAGAWIAVMCAVFWFPYDFTVEPARVAERWARLFDVPLVAYYYGSEYRALTEMLRRVLMFAPLGALLALAGTRWPWALAAAALAGLAVEIGQVLLPGKAIDTGDVLFGMLGAWLGHQAARALSRSRGGCDRRAGAAPPLRAADGAEEGGAIGLGASSRVRGGTAAAGVSGGSSCGTVAASVSGDSSRRRVGCASDMDRDAGGRGTQVPVPSDSGLAGGEAGARIGRGSKPAAARASRRDGHRRVREGAVGASLGAALVYALFVLAAGTAAAGLAAWSALPYNVRELFRPDAPALTGALLAVAVLVVVVPAPFAARLLGAPGDALRRGGMFAGVCVVQGLLAWALVDAAVPLESVHDVVGSPVLDWPWRFEQLARFTVLVLPIAVLGAGAACAVDALRWRRRAMSVFAERGSSGLRWLAVALPLLVVAHVVVVELAATDNLTELMRGGGVVAASVLIALWLLVTFFAAHLIGAALAGAHYAIAAAALGVGAAAVVVGRGLLEFALAGALDKYGQVFSAMQFLLSPSRDALVSGGELMVRYAWFHSAVIAGVALAALPAWWVARAMGDGDRFAPESRTGGRVTKGSPHAGRGCAGGPGPVHSRLDAAGCAEPARAPAASEAGHYVVLHADKAQVTFLRAEIRRTAHTPGEYLVAAYEDGVAFGSVARDPFAAVGADARHAIDVWLDASQLDRLRAAAGRDGDPAPLLRAALIARQSADG